MQKKKANARYARGMAPSPDGVTIQDGGIVAVGPCCPETGCTAIVWAALPPVCARCRTIFVLATPFRGRSPPGTPVSEQRLSSWHQGAREGVQVRDHVT